MHSFAPESYEFILLILGAVVLFATWLPHILAGRAVTFPIFYVIAGGLLFALPIDLLPSVGPQQHGELAERLTELAVIVALMGAGLKLDRPFGRRPWPSDATLEVRSKLFASNHSQRQHMTPGNRYNLQP